MAAPKKMPCHEELDWGEMWRQARDQRSWKPKQVEDWDRKAHSFARRNARSVYGRRFLALMRPQRHWSVLDVGCGPGTLALPMAALVERVTAMDFSGAMLAILDEAAEERGIINVSTVKGAWGDDWKTLGVGIHDAVVASRSLSVDDLAAALGKMNDHAREAVFLTDRVGPGPFDPRAFAAVGRPMRVGPDYIYTVNLLYAMGIHARVDFIRLEEKREYANIDEAVEGYGWMFRDLNAVEAGRLRTYVEARALRLAHGRIGIRDAHVPEWAFISWRKGEGGGRA